MAIVELTIEIPLELQEDLERLVLVARGRYGRGPIDAAERLLAERLSQLVEEGVLLPRPKP